MVSWFAGIAGQDVREIWMTRAAYISQSYFESLRPWHCICLSSCPQRAPLSIPVLLCAKSKRVIFFRGFQALLAKMFEDEGGEGGVSLSLSELLEEKGEPQLVYSTDSVRAAGRAIAQGRKAVSFFFFFFLFRRARLAAFCRSTWRL